MRVPLSRLFRRCLGPKRWHNAAMSDVRQMHRAPVDGGHVEYMLHGSGDPMLFIHGAGIADAFVPLMNRPPLAGIQQIHYRRRGYGQSTAAEGPPENFMARAAADAAQLLAHLRVDPAHVVWQLPVARSSHWILRATLLTPCGH